MNNARELNECILYIENNLDKVIDYNYFSKIFGCNVYTFQKVFSIITGMTVTEYIRRRRLTVAIKDINDGNKIIDVALKYGYNSASSFSRSFKRMHGVLPSNLKKSNITMNMQSVLKFDDIINDNDLTFQIINIDSLTLYGVKEEVDIDNIPTVAKKLWTSTKNKYSYFKEADISYGLTFTKNNKYYYMCAVDKNLPGLEEITIKKSKWIVFKGYSKLGEDIKKLFIKAESDYIPNIGINKNTEFEMEKYYKDCVEIFVNIN